MCEVVRERVDVLTSVSLGTADSARCKNKVKFKTERISS